MPRIRLGSSLAFSVSFVLHVSLLAMFVSGVTPGDNAGRKDVAVDVITQEQADLLYGSGSMEGGDPPKVEVTDIGLEPAPMNPLPPKPEKTESQTEERQAPRILSGLLEPDVLPAGDGERMEATSAKAPRKVERKSETKGSLKEATTSRKTDPKEKPTAPREEARNDQAPVDRNPGSDGGPMKRVASLGGVGESKGPLPPSMRQSMMQLIRKQIEICYVAPSGFSNYGTVPLILIRLNREGALNGLPKIVRAESTEPGRAIANSAIKAIRQCAPYKLPPRYAPYYEDWKEIRAEFEFSRG